MSVHSNESLQSGPEEREGRENSVLFSFPINSQSQLDLVARQPARDWQRPQDLVSDNVTVREVRKNSTFEKKHSKLTSFLQLTDTLPISELSPLITGILQSCQPDECIHQVGMVLSRLDPADVGILLRDLTLPLDKKLVLIDALGASGVSGGDLSDLISADEEEQVVERILVNMATARLIPNQ